MNVLLWHVHGSWTTSFVAGSHTCLIPRTPDRDTWGLGRAATWTWPETAVEVEPKMLQSAPVDVVVAQRTEEIELARRWTGMTPGTDVPLVYVEHNTPGAGAATTRHPLADRADVLIVHVTRFNALMWDCGSTPTVVVEHGVADPGRRWRVPDEGTARAAVVVNDPVRRGRAVGADLLRPLAHAIPMDLFGMNVNDASSALGIDPQRLSVHDNLPQADLHDALTRCGVYVHTCRWTSLGLSLIEAMLLGMPVAALAATEVPRAVPPDAGVVTTDPDHLVRGALALASDPARAEDAGAAARSAALQRYSLDRFLDDWDHVLKEMTN